LIYNAIELSYGNLVEKKRMPLSTKPNSNSNSRGGKGVILYSIDLARILEGCRGGGEIVCGGWANLVVVVVVGSNGDNWGVRAEGTFTLHVSDDIEVDLRH
jgi:hypothetical protein